MNEKEVIEAIKDIDTVLSSDYHYDETLEYQLASDDFQWLEMARDALEKQIPMKPKKLTYKLLLDAGWIYGCPSCGCACGENRYHPEVTQDDMFCTQCGQMLDWE